jgi:hypothetical protein
MTKPLIRIHNSETNEVTDREMTDAEYEQHLKDVTKKDGELAQIAGKAEAKKELLKKLGITEAEAELLLA